MVLLIARMGSILKKTSSLIVNFLGSISKYLGLCNPLKHIIELYKEINKPIEDEDLKKLMRVKHMQYMKVVWNINKVAELIQFSIIFIISFWVPYNDPARIHFKI